MGQHLDRGRHHSCRPLLDIPTAQTVDQTLHTWQNHLQGDALSHRIILETVQQRGQHLIAVSPTRHITTLRRGYEPMTVLERQPPIRSRPHLKTAPQPPRISDCVPLGLQPADDLGVSCPPRRHFGH